MLKFVFGCLALLLLFAPSVMAQEAGSVSVADGGFDVSIDLTEAAGSEVEISGLQDIFFEKEAGANALADETMSVCVYMSQGGTYGIRVTADPLTEDDSLFYPYSVSVSQMLLDAGSGTLNIDDQQVSQYVHPFQASMTQNCSLGPTVTLTVGDRDAGEFEGSFSATATVRVEIFPE